MAATKKKPCGSCGKRVPVQQDPPYPGHAPDCLYVADWLEHDAAEARGEPHPSALKQMRDKGGNWAVYRNQALDSVNVGHLQFLKYGEGCTAATPPRQYPVDNVHGMGWRYLHVGHVDLETGKIIYKEKT